MDVHVATGRVNNVACKAVCLYKYLPKCQNVVLCLLSGSRSVWIFRDPEGDSTYLFRNVGKYLHNHTASYPRRL